MPYASQSGNISMAFTGEAMISRPLTPFREPQFLALRELLHASDVRFTNGEMLFHDYENWPTYLSQTYMRCDPKLIGDLQWFGVNLMSCANNHGYDYGENGVLTNIAHLDAAGLVHAGSGRTYAEAIAPAYLETANGRVALVSATSSARANSRAGEQRRDINGRPGVNLVRWTNEWVVDDESFSALERVARGLGWRQHLPDWWTRGFGFDQYPDAQAVHFPDRNTLGVGSEDPAARFVRGDDFGRHSHAYQPDVERNLQSVSEARRMADWVVFSIHNHEGGQTVDEPSEHIQHLAHAVIDAGADVVVGHGPHRDRGIQIHNGKPILYSLGNFIMQNDHISLLPYDALVLQGLGHEHTATDFYDARTASRGESKFGPGWWSVVAVAQFEAKRLCEITLHPIELGFGLSRSQYGRPLLAEGEVAQQALTHFQRLCEPFGTPVEIAGGVGTIRLG